jgi:vancomycin permeability regulator SanA
VDARDVPRPLVLFAIALFAARRLGGASLGRGLAAAGRAAAVALAGLCAIDAAAYAGLRAAGGVGAGFPFSLSLVLVPVLLRAALRPAVPGPSRRWARASAAGVAGLALVLLHLLTFGATDYRRPADAAVVFGSAVRADGSPSGSLRDRTLTACRLHREGLVRFLVLSGGRDPSAPVSEPACMAAIARAEGVPDAALVLDEDGATSDATLANARRIARARGWRTMLLVSHDYHLARLHLLSRSMGLDARTVPARETARWPTKPLFVLREAAAWSWHLLRVLVA